MVTLNWLTLTEVSWVTMRSRTDGELDDRVGRRWLNVHERHRTMRLRTHTRTSHTLR